MLSELPVDRRHELWLRSEIHSTGLHVGHHVIKYRRKIKSKWDEGYLITAMNYGDGEFFCVMSKYPGSSAALQSYKINTDFKDFVTKKTDEGYLISYVGG